MNLNIKPDNNDNKNQDITKNILNRITYLINKRLSNFNLNKIDNIYENTKTLMAEYEKQNLKLNNKILMNKDINDLKKKIKSQNKNILKESNDSLISEIKNIDSNKNNDVQVVEEIPLIKSTSFNNYIELKKEQFNLDIEFVKKCLESHNINSDLKIFKKIYIDNVPNSCYPIRHISGNYQYWLNNKMNLDDENGSYIKDTIINNISNIYLEANLFDNYKNETDLFIKNQEYILNMSKDKYKNKLFKKILEIIEV